MASQKRINRRDFLKWSGILGSGAIVSASLLNNLDQLVAAGLAEVKNDGTIIIRSGCPAHNCGGRCVLKLFIRDRKIIRIETDDRHEDTVANPQLRACVRGRAYRPREYHPDRLKYPMKRVGKRGDGKFERISWDEALNMLADNLKRTKKEYGNSAIYIPYGTGSYNQINGRQTAVRLINLFGGALGYYNSYSWACISQATPTVYGTNITGNQRQDWMNTKLIIMWGWNPAEMRDGTNSDFLIKKAREKGVKTICIDPRMSMSAVSLADEWIPIRPGTDTAMMSAMAYVIITENLYDKKFIKKCCIGFDETQMPDGYESEESYSDYILGIKDGIPKTPEWAEEITAIPAETIKNIAIEYATAKPAVLYQGYGMQRRAYGEQPVRGGCVLAAITGNVGIHGGWASGLGLQAKDGGPFWNVFPTGSNPVQARIPTFLWTEAVLHGKDMDEKFGVKGVDKLHNNIKMIWAVASNALINQHADINRTAKILRDESKVEFIAVQDQFLTPTGKFADLILPACIQFETWGLEDGWKYGDDVIIMPQILEPPFETKSDYEICSLLAEKLGLKEAYTENRSEKEWIEWCVKQYKKSRFPEIPDLESLVKENKGLYAKPVNEPKISFDDFRKDPEKYPLNTASGKIEIFSKKLFELNKPDEIPAVPKYIQEWESPFGTEAKKYPLQAMGHHYMGRVHSTHDNNPWLEEAFPQRVFINPADAKQRGIRDGQKVKVYNQRGAIILPCRITPKILPGVVDVPQGAWWSPGKNGADMRGSVNTLTSHRWTPYAFGNAQHTIMVEIEKVS